MDKDDDLSNSKETTYTLVRRVCEKRIKGFQYLKRLHLGGIHFLNTVKISKEDLAAFYPNSKMAKKFVHFPFFLFVFPLVNWKSFGCMVWFLEFITCSFLIDPSNGFVWESASPHYCKLNILLIISRLFHFSWRNLSTSQVILPCKKWWVPSNLILTFIILCLTFLFLVIRNKSFARPRKKRTSLWWTQPIKKLDCTRIFRYPMWWVSSFVIFRILGPHLQKPTFPYPSIYDELSLLNWITLRCFTHCLRFCR
jgi:hypothetical protein